MKKMRLDTLLQNVPVRDIHGNTAVGVGAIRFDSRAVQPGDVFVAVRGAAADGHAFIDKAIEKGAKVIVAETISEDVITDPGSVVRVLVQDSSETIGLMASNFYHIPPAIWN